MKELSLIGGGAVLALAFTYLLSRSLRAEVDGMIAKLFVSHGSAVPLTANAEGWESGEEY